MKYIYKTILCNHTEVNLSLFHTKILIKFVTMQGNKITPETEDFVYSSACHYGV